MVNQLDTIDGITIHKRTLNVFVYQFKQFKSSFTQF